MATSTTRPGTHPGRDFFLPDKPGQYQTPTPFAHITIGPIDHGAAVPIHAGRPGEGGGRSPPATSMLEQYQGRLAKVEECSDPALRNPAPLFAAPYQDGQERMRAGGQIIMAPGCSEPPGQFTEYHIYPTGEKFDDVSQQYITRRKFVPLNITLHPEQMRTYMDATEAGQELRRRESLIVYRKNYFGIPRYQTFLFDLFTDYR